MRNIPVLVSACSLALALAACTGGTKVPAVEGAEEADVAAIHPGSEHTIPGGVGAIETKDDVKRAVALRALLAKEPDSARAHLELAATLARIRAAGEACAQGATLDEILTHLERAVALDASLAATARATEELDVVSTTVRYKVAMGGSLENPTVVSAMLVAADWHGPPSGVLPSTGTLDLAEGGAATGPTRALGDSGPEDTAFEGTWTQLEDTAGLTLAVAGSERELTLTAEGKLMDQDKLAWTNLASECGA